MGVSFWQADCVVIRQQVSRTQFRMDVVRPSSLAAMDRKLARRPAFRPALITLGVLALSAATLAWLTMAEAKRSLRIDAAKLTIVPVVEAPFHDFIPLRGQVVPL